MKSLTILFILVVGFCANDFAATNVKNDKNVFLGILRCIRKALVNGVPTIGIPSFDPFRFQRNFSSEIDFANYSFEIALEDMFVEGIPQWKTTQMDEQTIKEDNPVFDYTIYWKKLSFEGTWRAALAEAFTRNKIFGGDGTFVIEFHYCSFYGQFNFSKPGNDGKAARFNDLTFHLYTEDSELHIRNLGFSLFGGQFLKDLINLDFFATELGPAIKDMLNNEWLDNTEKMKALLSNCNRATFFI